MGVPTVNGGDSVDQLPSILFVGVEGVGKRSIVSNFFPLDDREEIVESEYLSPLLWTIDTKYYTADVTLQLAGISRHDFISGGSISLPKRHVALVMVFDVTQDTSFVALQQWASRLDLADHDILLCIGNKVDKVSSHPAHTQYRRRRLARGDAGIVSAPDIRELDDFGVQRNEGSSFLNKDEDSEQAEESGSSGTEEAPQLDLSREEQHRKVTEWCADNCVEYIESCVVDPEFDKAISADGEEQGVARIKSALAAHLWPGHRRKEQGLSPSPSELRPGTNNSHSEDEREEGSEEDSESEAEEFGYELLGVDDGHDSWEPFDPQQKGEAISENVTNSVEVVDVTPDNNSWATNWQSAPTSQPNTGDHSKGDVNRGFLDEPVFRATPPVEDGNVGGIGVEENVRSGLRGETEDLSEPGIRVLNAEERLPPVAVGNLSSVCPDAHLRENSALPSASTMPLGDCSNDHMETNCGGNGINDAANVPAESGSVDGHDLELDGSRIVHGGLGYDEELRLADSDPPGASSFEAIERMVGEMSAMRSNLRGMPDETRKEMAARMAFRLAKMLGDSDEDE